MEFIGFIFQMGTFHNVEPPSLGYMWYVITVKNICSFRCMFIKNINKVTPKSSVVLAVNIEKTLLSHKVNFSEETTLVI